jgi:beta-lactamase class C
MYFTHSKECAMHKKVTILLKLVSAATCMLAASSHAADQCKIKDTVDQVIAPVMEKYTIPGMAIAVIVNGQRCFYNYGVMSKDTGQGITSDTLFEIGSVSKTLTATLATFAQADGKLALSDSASKLLPALRGSSFDNISLLNLATHTAGGLPQQVPDQIHTMDQLMEYYKNWKPKYAAGTARTYSNPSVGLLGMIAAKSMRVPFDEAMEKQLFPALGMTRSYINVPADHMSRYAQGYTTKDIPVRMTPDILAHEAYGVRTTTADLIQFIGVNLEPKQLDPKWQRALGDAQLPQFQAGAMAQSLMWEQYPFPVKLEQLLEGNAGTMAFDDHKVSSLPSPPRQQANVLINKTGSTRGFGAYVAFIPAKKIGIVILANKSYPNAARVTAAYQILNQLASQ